MSAAPPAGMGGCRLPDLLFAGLRVGRSHHHGFLQQVPQQLLPVRVSRPALGLPPVLPSLQPDPASPRPTRSSAASWTLPSTHSLEILAVPGLGSVTVEQGTLRQKREGVMTVMPQGSVRTQEPHTHLKRPRTDQRCVCS